MRRLVWCCALLGLLMIGVTVAQDAVQGNGSAPAEPQGEAMIPGAMGDDPSMLELLRRGGPLMYPLYLLSFVMAGFAIERAISLQRQRILPPDIVARIRDVSAERHGPVDVQRLLEDISASNSPIVRIVRAGLRKAYRPAPEIEKAIEDAGAKEAAGMRRNCKVLSVTANVAPLLGLLGTVMGMIKAFMTVASREEALGRTELLAAGIYQALVTTATGLCIAIPALVFYYLLTDKIERLVIEMDDFTIDLIERMSRPGDLVEGR